MNELPGADAKQLERSIRSEEVSGQIVDTRARLFTKKQTRDKYLEFMKQGKNVDEVLKVQNEVNALQEEIESAESRLAWLSGQAHYSTVELNYFEPKAGYTSASQRSLGGRMTAALKEGAGGLGNLMVGLLYLWPMWLIGFLLLWLLRKRSWLRLHKNR
nr:DUF4349 domain-containing protein [Niabella agricola]